MKGHRAERLANLYDLPVEMRSGLLLRTDPKDRTCGLYEFSSFLVQVLFHMSAHLYIPSLSLLLFNIAWNSFARVVLREHKYVDYHAMTHQAVRYPICTLGGFEAWKKRVLNLKEV